MRLVKSVNFSNAWLMIFFVGAVSFSATVLTPQYLQTLMGYSAETVGMTLSVGALVMFLVMPIVGQLTSRVQARCLIAFGWSAAAASMFFQPRR
jgi:MFS transporter, DHA2 family, multidrug resistance protein